MTNSCSCRHFDFSHAELLPEVYGAEAFLLMMPSAWSSHALWNISKPLALRCSLTCKDAASACCSTLSQQRFALEQRQVARAVAAEVKEVEAEVRERVACAFLEGGLQVGEVGCAAFIENDDFAVERDVVDGQPGDLGGDGLDAVRPVQAGAGKHLNG